MEEAGFNDLQMLSKYSINDRLLLKKWQEPNRIKEITKMHLPMTQLIVWSFCKKP